MQADLRFLPPVNHVFVDVENVKKVELFVLGQKNYIVHLFLGPTNKKLDVEVVERMLEHSQVVKMIRSPKAGKNALDFVLAYHLGQAVLTDPKAYFHLLSRDEGFDSLVELLKARNVKVKRHASWQELEAWVAAKSAASIANGQAVANGAPKAVVNGGPEKSPSLSQSAEKFLNNLTKSAKNRPKKKTTLVSHAKSSLGKSASETDGEKVVAELLKGGHLKIDEKGAVSYN
ncbi:MAG: NYN domain-containing protein [Verrucomicrobiaceae bacterium]|nr:MAG: NYN domain-containing protein [Verrucomicrobiaceae bacterium]